MVVATGGNKLSGFAEFNSIAAATSALTCIQASNGICVDGKKLVIDYAGPRRKQPTSHRPSTPQEPSSPVAPLSSVPSSSTTKPPPAVHLVESSNCLRVRCGEWWDMPPKVFIKVAQQLDGFTSIRFRESIPSALPAHD